MEQPDRTDQADHDQAQVQGHEIAAAKEPEKGKVEYFNLFMLAHFNQNYW